MTMPMARRTLLATTAAALLFPLPVSARMPGEPRPLLVLLEMDPWRMVIGSDSPRFALYDDGEVIYRTADGYKSVKLNATERAALILHLNVPGIITHAKYYKADHATDQPLTSLFVFGGEKQVVARVYGRLDPARGGSSEVRAKVPAEILGAYDKLTNFAHPWAKAWLPAQIEVMIWPYEYAPEASIEWPKGWPGPDHPTTVKRDEDSYSLFLPASEYPALVRFLGTQNQKGAVRIDGKKWAAGTRFPFPGESSWMRYRGD